MALCVLGVGGVYRYVVTGGLTARQKASALERVVARSLIDFSVPMAARTLKNPLEGSDANVSAGREGVPSELRGVSWLRRAGVC